MGILALRVKNFKGIEGDTNFEIAPLTLFIGPNSSGKSTAIHALGALSQTVKIGDSSRAIILDDEYAQIHLGRFIEIIHSKSYEDSFELGIVISDKNPQIRRALGLDGKSELLITAKYCFKSSKRTQEIFIESATFEFGGRSIVIKRTPKSDHYVVSDSGSNATPEAFFSGNLQFEIGWIANASEDALKTYQALILVQRVVVSELRNTYYLGPFRQSPLRRYAHKGSSPNEVGASGEAAVSLLANEYIATTKRIHHVQLSTWLETLGLAKKLKVKRVGTSDLFDLTITLPDDDSLPIADLGYGLSQILPVLVQCSFAKKGSTLLFEQPELHLHPGAARNLATVFTNVISEKKVHIIAETHSRELFLQVFEEVRQGRISRNDVVAYDVHRENGCSHYKKIEILEDAKGYLEPSHPWGKRLDHPS